jgi:hypothetical protein
MEIPQGANLSPDSARARRTFLMAFFSRLLISWYVKWAQI